MSFLDPTSQAGYGNPQGASSPYQQYMAPIASNSPTTPSAYTPYVPPAQQLAAAQQYVHPAVQAAATTPGASLTSQQVQQLQQQPLNFGALASGQGISGPVTPPGAQTQPGSYYGGNAPAKPKSTKQLSAEQQQQQRYQSIQNEFNKIVDPNNLTAQQVNGPQANATAIWLAKMASQLPNSTATALLKKIPQNTTLASLVSQYIANPNAATQGPAQPTALSDPLALQTMFHDVFGPLYKQAFSMNAAAPANYQSAMNAAIAGSNLPANEQSQLRSQTAATSDLMSQVNQQQRLASATGPAFDTMISALQALQGQAAQYQGEAEKAYAQGQAAAVAPFYTGQGATTTPTAGVPAGQLNLSQMLAGIGVTP